MHCQVGGWWSEKQWPLITEVERFKSSNTFWEGQAEKEREALKRVTGHGMLEWTLEFYKFISFAVYDILC